MKKEYFYIIILSICLIVVSWGIYMVLATSYDVKKKEEAIGNVEVSTNETFIATAVEDEEKVSPNCKFALKKYYDECNHFDYKESELPIELVNLTRQEVEDYYENWEVEEFSNNQLVLYQEIDGYCNQHFLIKLDDGIVKIFRYTTNGELSLYKETEVYEEYLPENDAEKLREGIMVYSEGMLSSVLEDFE